MHASPSASAIERDAKNNCVADHGRHRLVGVIMAFALKELFADQDFRFQLTLRRSDLREFFQPRNPAALEERRRWLDGDCDLYAATTPDAGPLVAQMQSLAASWSIPVPTEPTANDVHSSLIRLGKAFEPDLLLLQPDAGGEFVLKAGVVCFPSSWALTEKIGRPLDAIHATVPGLNPSIGTAISTFLERLKPGIAYERSNWGIAATPELNLHPSLNRPRLKPPLDPDRTWLRIEDQVLSRMPDGESLLFGIDLRIIPIQEALHDPAIRKGFHRAMLTMPAGLAAYKGLTPVLPDLLALSAD